MYRINPDLDINDLIDGRTILYLSKQLPFNRENLSKTLKGTISCTYDRAEQIVEYCKPDSKVEDYFIKDKKEV